jgi:hypothetical protein
MAAKIEPQSQPRRGVEGDNDPQADHQAIHDDTPLAATGLQT